MVTRNTIAKFFRDFAENHYQLKGFGYGDFWEISQSQGARYPLMWVSPQPASISGNEVSHTYAIAIADRVRNGEENELEVESDCFQICQDLIAALNDQSETEWVLDENVTLQPFTEWSKDDDAGFIMTLTFKVDNTYDACAIPWTGAPEPGDGGCADAALTVNGISFTNISSGATYNLIVRDTEGNLVGSKDGNVWRVPSAGTTCADAVARLRNSLGTILSTTNIASGVTQNIDAPDATAVVKNTVGTTLVTETVPAGASENITAPDSTAVLKDTAGNTLSTQDIPAGTSDDVEAPDGNVTIKDQDGNTLGTGSVRSGQTKDINVTVDKLIRNEFAEGVDEVTITFTAAMAGTYDTETNDGASGAYEYKKNAGSYGAWVTMTFVATDTLSIRRADDSAAGFSQITT